MCSFWVCLAGKTATITLTAFVSGGGPASAAAHIAANPAPPPAPINTLDTILILRLEDGADSFISCHGSLLPSCFGMDLDALLTLGGSPVLTADDLQQGQGKGQQLLQQGLAAAAAGVMQGGADDIDLLGLQQQLQGQLGLGQAAAAGNGVVTGLEERAPKEVQRLVNFLQVRSWKRQLMETMYVHASTAVCWLLVTPSKSVEVSCTQASGCQRPTQRPRCRSRWLPATQV
jgi:hypothetical protein